MTLELQEIARAMGAAGNADATRVKGWSVDTRTQNRGDVYFALRGPNHDGHEFVSTAVEKGAAAVVVERPVAVPNALLVSDTLRALQDLAGWARQRWGGTVIGVTGSAGKTTTKDAIAHLLSVEMPVGRTVGNLNNHVGVPLSILRLPDECRAAVLEIGMNHAGEIRELSAIARPDIGVVTNVGYAHVEFFDSIDGVAAAKRELIEALPRDGVAVLNADDPRVSKFREVHPGRTITFGFSESADVRACLVGDARGGAASVPSGAPLAYARGSELSRDREGLVGEGQTEGAACVGGERGSGVAFRALGVDFETPLTGRHAVMNLLAAIAVAHAFEIAPERLREAVRTFTVGKMRGERIEHAGVVVWNDCYNSNPEAARSMIDVLRETAARKRIAVLGEMLELGHAADELHRQVGRYAAEHGVDLLVGVRGSARAMVEAAREAGAEARFFEDAQEAGRFAKHAARAGDAVLFKGSRGVHIEEALERFVS